MLRNPLVSIIIASYNHEKYIGRCIRSLLNQDINSNAYEIIVVNDGSSDNTKKILSNYKEDITLIENEKNIGLPASLNMAIKKVRSPYIVRVDSDDYVNASFINILSMLLTSNPEMDAVSCDYYEVNEKEEIIRKVSCADEPIACGIMFRIEHIIDIGLYDEKFLLYEDKDLRNRFIKKYYIDRIQLPLYRYRKHENNITSNLEARKKYEKMLQDKHIKNNNL